MVGFGGYIAQSMHVSCTSTDVAVFAIEPHHLLDCSDVATSSIDVPLSLGRYRHECVGNVALCDNGFTLSLWLASPPQQTSDSGVAHRYYFSSGGQSQYSNGVYVRQNYGQEFEVGFAVDDRAWSVHELYIDPGAYVNVVITWQTSLRVYVDGVMAGVDYAGRERVYVPSSVDPFPDLVIGAANDALMHMGSDYEMTSWVCGNITHWSETTLPVDVPDLIG